MLVVGLYLNLLTISYIFTSSNELIENVLFFSFFFFSYRLLLPIVYIQLCIEAQRCFRRMNFETCLNQEEWAFGKRINYKRNSYLLLCNANILQGALQLIWSGLSVGNNITSIHNIHIFSI